MWCLFAYVADQVPASKLGKFNFYILQWFCIRIAKEVVSNDYGDDAVIGYGIMITLPIGGWDGLQYMPFKKPHYFRVRTIKSARP